MNRFLEERFRKLRRQIQDDLERIGIVASFFEGMTQKQATDTLAKVIKAMRAAHHPDHGGSPEKIKEFALIPNATRDKAAFAQYVNGLMSSSISLREEIEKGHFKSGRPIQDALTRVGINHTFFHRMTDEKAAEWLLTVIKQLLTVHHPDCGGSAKRAMQLNQIRDWIKEETRSSDFIKRLKKESTTAKLSEFDSNETPVKKITSKGVDKAFRTTRQSRKK